MIKPIHPLIFIVLRPASLSSTSCLFLHSSSFSYSGVSIISSIDQVWASLQHRQAHPEARLCDSSISVQSFWSWSMLRRTCSLCIPESIPITLPMQQRRGVKKTHRSIQVPGVRAAARWVRNPSFSNTETYQGRKPADRSKTLPPSFSAWLRASTCMAAASPWGSNQSMESMIWHIHISHQRLPIFIPATPTHHGNRQSRWFDPSNDFIDLICMYAETGERLRSRESGMCLWA
jgi:hypothetical protein